MGVWDDLKLVHLASQGSFIRGLGYYENEAVLNGEKTGDDIYKGQVSGSKDNIYDVMIDINHPGKSSCTCPFAIGRRVVCKHMVALYFFHFPEQADAINEEWEEEEREKEKYYEEWEADYSLFRQEKLEEVTSYVLALKEDQLREELIEALMREFDSGYPDPDEFYDDQDDDYFY